MSVEIQKLAVEIIYRLSRAVRMSKIYAVNNRIFRHQAQLLLDSIQQAGLQAGQASFSLRQDSMFFNDQRVKFGFSSYYLFKFLKAAMLDKEIGELLIKPEVKEAELTAFVHFLGSRLPADDDVFEQALEHLAQAEIQNISVEKLPPFEKSPQPEKAAKKIFFLTITHLKEIFEQQDQSKNRAPILTTKRLMQSIFNLISENESFLHGLTNIKNFDGYTLNHSVNVCVLSISLGKKLGLDRRELVELGLSAFFHDFGKLDIPKEILLKPGSLTSEERRIIEKHPHLGAEKLVQLKEFRFLPLSALSVAMEHHSREDRTGYPKYRKKPTINLFSKIVKITDVYDALTTERPYRPDHMSQEEALMFMQERSGTEFDPLLLKVFVHMMGDVPVGSLVLLDTGEIGIAYEINPSAHFRQRPKVKLITDPQGNKKDGDIIDLTQKAPERQEFERSIIKILDTRKYPIKTADYFVAQAE